MKKLIWITTFCFPWAIVAPVFAQDTWSEPVPGIAYLRRALPDQKIHAAIVDMTRQEFFLRVTRADEKFQTTTGFARSVGAVAAINGDWLNLDNDSLPVGLSIGEGWHWEGTRDAFNWSFLACSVERRCEIDSSYSERPIHWSWHNVVGGNGAVLVVAGAPQHYPDPFYSTDRHPRSAVGYNADQTRLILLAVEGRRAGSAGMTFNEVADLMVELGAFDAMMLDGGGSTALVLGGNRVNALPSNQDGERVVVNHLAVVAGIMDARCASRPNGRYCKDRTWIATCQGGNFSEGDCGYFGCTCEEGLGTAYCVHPYCKNGGNGSACKTNTVLVTCEAGRPSEGDCGYYGATCEESAGTAYCVHPFCTHGGNASWCLDDRRLATCAMGAYTETPCPADEACQGGQCTRPSSPEICDNAVDDDKDGHTDCADPDCAAAAGCLPPDGGVETDATPDGGVTPDGADASSPGDRAGAEERDDPAEDVVIAGGCATAPGRPGILLLLAAIPFLRRGRHLGMIP